MWVEFVVGSRRVLRFSAFRKNQHSKFQFDQDKDQRRLMWLPLEIVNLVILFTVFSLWCITMFPVTQRRRFLFKRGMKIFINDLFVLQVA